MTQYGEDFRQQRKFMKEVLGGDVIRRHEALLDEEGKRMLQGIFKAPKECDRLLRRSVSSININPSTTNTHNTQPKHNSFSKY
jgi:hypothetical protein